MALNYRISNTVHMHISGSVERFLFSQVFLQKILSPDNMKYQRNTSLLKDKGENIRKKVRKQSLVLLV